MAKTSERGQPGGQRDQQVADHVGADLVHHHVGDAAGLRAAGLREQPHRIVPQPGHVGHEVDGEHHHRQRVEQRAEQAADEPQRAAAQLAGQAREQVLDLAGQVVAVGQLAETGRTVGQARDVTGKIVHQGLELVDHRRDDRDQERRRQAARDQEDDQHGQAAAHAPAGQHADRRVQADRDEQRDEHPDQQRTGGVDRDGRGGHREDAEARVQTPAEHHPRMRAGSPAPGRGRRILLMRRLVLGHRAHFGQCRPATIAAASSLPQQTSIGMQAPGRTRVDDMEVRAARDTAGAYSPT